ncbi:MAG: winged helix DNA-binding domain-containing protein [Thermomicrobiales bacterium]|nr:winged helix DNA-binding domain-containing protein [Thermomicrobiales bacterium]
MRLSQRALNRATLSRQMLLQREVVPLDTAVQQLVALQAQEPASPYLALWNRLDQFDAADLDTAFTDLRVVKSNAVRMTLHAIHIDDYPIFRQASEPTIHAARLRDRRFVASGIGEEETAALVAELLEQAAEPRPADELQAWVNERLGDAAHPGAWWGLRQYSPLLHVPSGATWTFGGKRGFVAPPQLPATGEAASADGMKALTLRYLAAFGPASIADVALFAMVQRSRVRAALKDLHDQVIEIEGPDGKPLYDVPNAPTPDEDTPAPPRLLGMWDNILLAYSVRDRIIPPEHRKLVIRINGDVLPTLLVDGYVVGIWRATEAGIEAMAFEPLSDDVWEQLSAEAEQLQEFLAARDPQVFRRYNHWWDKPLPGTPRLLAGG